ncbi:MAG: hypothetical protein J0I20_28285 [Chloroflexi bacterium]|nr:hypothetical protein [Chloroflexota bacterium]OJV97584.1 MAG: hypothetical protein BGO39_07415 [Chloroflexi bacterium 54-19]
MDNTNSSPKIETVLVALTQMTFDRLEKRTGDLEESGEMETGEPDFWEQAQYRWEMAGALVEALRASGRTAEIVRLPQRSFIPRDISKAAFAWRLVDLKESNGRPIDLVVCLDFPAWSLQHPAKCCWLTSLPNFVTRSRSMVSPGDYPSGHSHKPISLTRSDRQAEDAKAIAGLLQAERRGLAESRRVLAATRPLAEELARRGLQVEYIPVPPDLSVGPTDPLWQAALKRLLKEPV